MIHFPRFIIENSLAFMLSWPYVSYLFGSSQNCPLPQVTIINLESLNHGFQVNTQILCALTQSLKLSTALLVG